MIGCNHYGLSAVAKGYSLVGRRNPHSPTTSRWVKKNPGLRPTPHYCSRPAGFKASAAARPWDHEEPVWELRASGFRVFYDVNDARRRVVIRAVRKKPPHRTTEEIL